MYGICGHAEQPEYMQQLNTQAEYSQGFAVEATCYYYYWVHLYDIATCYLQLVAFHPPILFLDELLKKWLFLGEGGPPPF